MKAAKTVKITAIILIIIIIGAVWAVLAHGDKLIKTAVEKGGALALKVPVSLDSVELSIWAGSISLNGLTITNPQGYSHDNLLQCHKTSVAVDTGSLFSDKIKVSNIYLDNITVTMEQKGINQTNLQEILANIEKEDSEKPDTSTTETNDEKPAQGLIIKHLEIRNTTVKVKLLPIPGKVDTLTIKLSPIIMDDFDPDKPLTTADVSQRVIVAIAGGILEQGSELPAALIGGLGEQLGNLGNLSGQILKSGVDIGSGVLKEGEKIGSEIDKSLKGLGGLIKPKKSDKSE